MQIIGAVKILYRKNYYVFADLFTDIFAGIITTGPALFSVSIYLVTYQKVGYLCNRLGTYIKGMYIYNRMYLSRKPLQKLCHMTLTYWTYKVHAYYLL